MEQYFKNKVVRVTDDSSSDYNRNLTKYNAVSVSDEITYYLRIHLRSRGSYQGPADSSNCSLRIRTVRILSVLL